MTEEQQESRPTEWALYDRLARPFDQTFFREGAGHDRLEYITGEQCTRRLNEDLGFLNWSFRIVEHGIHAEADECWVLGELTTIIDGRTIVKQQFGSQKVKRSRSSGTPLDLGFDLKGAATDCLKKTASLIGVALYLSHKEAAAVRQEAGRPTPRQPEDESTDIQVNADGSPVCMIDRGGAMCGVPLSGWEAKGDFPAKDAYWVAQWQIKQPQFGLPLCFGHQKGVKEGHIEPVRWVQRPREEREATYALLATEAADLGHRQSATLRSTDPSTLADDVLDVSARKLAKWIEEHRKSAAVAV